MSNEKIDAEDVKRAFANTIFLAQHSIYYSTEFHNKYFSIIKKVASDYIERMEKKDE